MSSIQSAALIGRPRKEIELLPKKGILLLEMDKRGLVHCPVWPQMAAHFGTFTFRRDQSSHLRVVSRMAWQFALYPASMQLGMCHQCTVVWAAG